MLFVSHGRAGYIDPKLMLMAEQQSGSLPMRLWWHRWMVGAGSGCCLAAWLAERAELLHITCARHTHTVHTVTIMHQRFNNCFCNHIIANFPPAPCLNHRSWINMVREESCVHRESQIIQNFRCLRSIPHSQGQHSLRNCCLLQISYEKAYLSCFGVFTLRQQTECLDISGTLCRQPRAS